MNILAINPWIYDFAAYDFWLKPYGFLVLLTYLENKGVNVRYIDCLEKKLSTDKFGRGKYYSEVISKPNILKSIPRRFKRYGITIEEFSTKLKLIIPQPDFILLTSSMTYWYPALEDTLILLKDYFPRVPIILGGTYATLCFEHAIRNIPCDYIFKGEDLEAFFKLLNIEFNYEKFYSTLPDYQKFYPQCNYIVLRTSWGCPFRCSYCAIKNLFPNFFRLPQEKIIEFILQHYHRGIKDFVFYDDALLYPPEYIKGLLRKVEKERINIRFHTPNALHLKFLDEELVHLLKKTGFINPHFGLETLNPQLQKEWTDKITINEGIRGINLLKKGGFHQGEFSVYLLLGYPGQDLTTFKKEIDILHSLGAKISLAEFSPTPGTEIFERYKEKLKEPLLHNNSIFCFFPHLPLKEFYRIKNYVRMLNKKFL